MNRTLRLIARTIRSCKEDSAFITNLHNFKSPNWVLRIVLASAIFLVYSNSLYGPFQYDDYSDILENQSIRQLWPLKNLFFAIGSGFVTRPVVNFTFALNVATGGINPFHFHITNLGIHIGTSLILFGTLCRTLSLPSVSDKFKGQSVTLSFIISALWALHPIQTESVAYITQRYESLMGLFVLLTFYSVIRVGTASSSVKWGVLAFVSCLLALGSKEVAVSVPVLVFLFDRTFMAGSFRQAWRLRKTLYLSLILALACFAFIQFYATRRTFAGFGLGMEWWQYALNQPSVILHYLRLVIWPHPLNFDYYWSPAQNWKQLLPGVISIGCLVGVTIWWALRKPALAFLSISFFMILAPTSSIMPLLDLAVEHRMYLPLAPVLILLVCGGYIFISNSGQNYFINKIANKNLYIVIFICYISLFGALTYVRNEDFQNPLDLWRDSVSKAPENPRAHHNYAINLSEAGYAIEANMHFMAAIRLAPNMPLFRSNFGIFLGKIGRYEESLQQLRLAIRMEPDNYKHYINLGIILLAKGSLDNAVVCLHEANRMNSKVALPHAILSTIYLSKHDVEDALEMIQTALRLEPQSSAYYYQLGIIQLIMKDYTAASSAFASACRYDGDSEIMTSKIAWAYHDIGRDAEALTLLRRALQKKPDHVQSRIRLAWILATSPDDRVRNGSEALAIAQKLLANQSNRTPELLDLLAVSLAESGHFAEATTAIHEGEAILLEAMAKSPGSKGEWLTDFKRRLTLFQSAQPFRDTPRGLLPPLSNKGSNT